MLGFGAIRQLAIRQMPGVQQVALIGAMQVRASAQPGMSALAPVAGKMSVNASSKVVPGVNIASRLHAAIAAKATGGVVLPARIVAQVRVSVTPGVNIPSRLMTSTRLRAPGGVAIPGHITAAARARVTPGANLASSIRARVMMRAPGGVILPARITVQVKGRADQFFYPGSGHSFFPGLPQPAYKVKRAKPFRPIWDIRRRQEIEEERKRNEPKPAPLPPDDIFSSPATITVQLDRLPDFSSLAFGEWRDVEKATREAEDASDAEFVLRAVVEADVSDVADAFAAIQSTADKMLALALQEAAKPQAPKRIEIAIPPHSGARSYHEQMQDVTDHADAMAALREGGIIPEEA